MSRCEHCRVWDTNYYCDECQKLICDRCYQRCSKDTYVCLRCISEKCSNCNNNCCSHHTCDNCKKI